MSGINREICRADVIWAIRPMYFLEPPFGALQSSNQPVGAGVFAWRPSMERRLNPTYRARTWRQTLLGGLRTGAFPSGLNSVGVVIQASMATGTIPGLLAEKVCQGGLKLRRKTALSRLSAKNIQLWAPFFLALLPKNWPKSVHVYLAQRWMPSSLTPRDPHGFPPGCVILANVAHKPYQ